MIQFFPYLLILACPLTMGVMMWLMMRGTENGKKPDPRVSELESQLNELRSAMRGSAAKTEEEQPAAVPVTAART